eukprot:6422622-Pyramimonas_sp.AAC.1
MIRAAARVRNMLQQLPLDTSHDGAEDSRRITLRSIARAIWQQDTHLTSLLRHNTEYGQRFLNVDNGAVSLLNSSEFAETVIRTNAEWHERLQRHAAAQALRGDSQRCEPAELSREQWRKMQRTSARRARLWSDSRRQLILNGIRHNSSGHSTMPPAVADVICSPHVAPQEQ